MSSIGRGYILYDMWVEPIWGCHKLVNKGPAQDPPMGKPCPWSKAPRSQGPQDLQSPCKPSTYRSLGWVLEPSVQAVYN